VIAMRADVASGAALVRIAPDPGRREPGRGAWLHVNQACVDAAVRRRAFSRALRVAVATDPSLVGEYVAQHASPHHAPAHHPGPTREPKAEMNP